MIKLYSKTESSYKRYYYHLSRNIIICARDMLCSKNFKKFEIFLSLYLTLADEPTGNLDDASSKVVEDIFDMLHREMKKTIILVTHDLDFANKSEKKYSILNGRLVAE